MCPVVLSWSHHSPRSTTHKFSSLHFSLSSHHSFSSLFLFSSNLIGLFLLPIHLQLQFPPLSSNSPVISELVTRISVRMRNPSSVKREFLRKWIKGLGKCRMLKKDMNFLERKKAIKLSADLAMASTRSPDTRWSRALIAKATSSGDHDNDSYNKILFKHIVGPSANQKSPKGKVVCTTSSSSSSSGRCRSRSILKRSRMVRRVVKKEMMKKIGSPKVMAKRLVKKKTRKLKSLLPGGESMDDDVVLIQETLDYIQSLSAQVQVMRCLAAASQIITKS